jgi:hypothetical protein
MNFNDKITALASILDLDREAEERDAAQSEICQRFRVDSPDNAAALDAAKDEAGSQSPMMFLRGDGPACRALRVRLGEWCGRLNIEFPGATVIRVRVGLPAMAPSADGGRLVQTIAENAIDEAARLFEEITP